MSVAETEISFHLGRLLFRCKRLEFLDKVCLNMPNHATVYNFITIILEVLQVMVACNLNKQIVLC